MSDPEERFAALYAEHYPPILRYAARRIDSERARDVAMETFLVAWRRLADVPRSHDKALLWLYGVARNTLANEQRGNRRRGRLLARLQALTPPTSAVDHGPATVEAIHVRAAISRLRPADQEVLQLIGWEGLDVAGAAQVIGCSPRTLSVRLHRARRRLAAALAQAEAESEPESGAVPSGRSPDRATA